MNTRSKSIQNLPEELFKETIKHLHGEFWKFFVVSQFLLTSYDSMTDDNTKEYSKEKFEKQKFGKFKLIFDDEKFEDSKQLIFQSKILKKLVKTKGLAIK